MNKFVFHPVGQGLFYTGSLNDGNYKFVYDCGTANNQAYLTKEIDNCFPEIFYSESKPVIDFVVISHMHKDHYSGLWNLLKKWKVRKLYLPYLGDYDNDALLLNFYYDIYINDNNNLAMSDNERDRLYDFMLSLYGITDNGTYREYIQNVIFVRENIENQFQKNDGEFWRFHFLYNKADKIKVDEINDKCRQLLEGEIYEKCKDMKEFISKYGTKDVSKVYREVFKTGAEINNTSIMLLHYPVEKINNLYFHACVNLDCCDCIKCMRRYYAYRPSRGVTLLTGDIKLDTSGAREIKRVQTTEFKDTHVSVLQIPHHGARENWNAIKSNNIDSDIYVISFGYGNRYKHPSVEVIDDLTNKNMEYYCVTQNQCYVYYIR